jgi:UDP-glucose:(heptosyl)LPS alpha-1,3-glucosyltransferase
MKIALIVHDLHEHGGQSLYTRILADELSTRHDVTVFANRCVRPGDAQWKSLAVLAWRRNALATVNSFPVGLKKHDLSNFKIRHAQGLCGGQPNVVTAHICAAAYLDALQGISPRARASLRLMAAAEARFYRRFRGHVIAVSRKVASELRELYHFRGPLSVIYHGVEAARFRQAIDYLTRMASRRELGLATNDTVALYIGDLTKSHRHLKAIAAAQPRVQFVIVSCSKQYHWRARNVRIVPPTENIARYYSAADAFVFPTSYDAFGMVLLEAMAAGLTVFTSDRAGAAELITPGKDGFVIPLENWVEATSELLLQKDVLQRVRCEALDSAKRHTWSEVLRRVEQIYSAVAISPSQESATSSKTDYKHKYGYR